MPVTELALLRLKDGVTLTQPTIKARLATAKHAMEAFTNQPFAYYQQHEDPAFVYLLGSWASVSQHWDEWIPSEANQQLLELLKDDVSVEWMFHVEVDKATLPLEAPVLAVGRHSIKEEKRKEFSTTFDAVKHNLTEATKPWPVTGGWRVEPASEGIAEWVLFSGWEDVEAHGTFGRSDAFNEYARIVPFVDEFDVKHARPLIV